MKFARIAPDLALTPQLRTEDLDEVAAAGFRAIVNNRPDREEAGQPASEKIEAAAHRLGLAYRHIPLEPGQFGENEMAAFRKALRELPQPVLALCRTGTRSASLWALCEATSNSPNRIISAAAAAGYDLEPLRARLEALAAAHS